MHGPDVRLTRVARLPIAPDQLVSVGRRQITHAPAGDVANGGGVPDDEIGGNVGRAELRCADPADDVRGFVSGDVADGAASNGPPSKSTRRLLINGKHFSIKIWLGAVAFEITDVKPPETLLHKLRTPIVTRDRLNVIRRQRFRKSRRRLRRD
jgi:hypothetical protein